MPLILPDSCSKHQIPGPDSRVESRQISVREKSIDDVRDTYAGTYSGALYNGPCRGSPARLLRRNLYALQDVLHRGPKRWKIRAPKARVDPEDVVTKSNIPRVALFRPGRVLGTPVVLEGRL